MPRGVVGALVALAFVSSLALAAPATAASEPTGHIVVYASDVRADAARAKTDRLERAHGFRADFRYRAALRGFAAKLTAAQVAALAADPEVAFVAPDLTLRATGLVNVAAGETLPTGVRRMGGVVNGMAHGGNSANVAVIDTGVDFGLSSDLNVANGKNCVDATPGALAQDDNGHGTLVSGVIAAKNDGPGIVGVAPGATVYAVKVLSAEGSGTVGQVVCGIDWVAENAAALGIKVANLSLGGPGSNDNSCGARNNDALHVAVCGLVGSGVTVVVAAGNSAANIARFIPASYPEALTVTAMADCDGKPGTDPNDIMCWLIFPLLGEQDERYASFSNFATKAADAQHVIAAPGVFILSSWLFGFYMEVSGTSIAAPHVAGTVAHCLGIAASPGPCAGKTPAEIAQKLRDDAKASAGENPMYGFTGDPDHQVRNRYYGHLVWAGGY